MVSVITVTYNRSAFLDKAVRSVLGQTYSDFEYLIVDDGSTDDSRQIVEAFGDHRIKYFYVPHCGFISKLKNIALNQARGEIIAFIDSDDTWTSNSLEKTVEAFQHYNAYSVVSNAAVLSGGTETALFKNEKTFQLYGDLLHQKLFNDDFLTCTCCFSFRPAADKLRYNETLRAGDSDFFLKILSRGNTVVLLDKLAVIVRHDGNMTAPHTYDAPFIQAYLEDLETFRYLLDQNKITSATYKKAVSLHLYKLGSNLKRIGHNKDARLHLKKSFMIYPRNIKALFKYFFSVF